jgi:hypothetical protein
MKPTPIKETAVMDSKSKYEAAIFNKFISVYPYKINPETIQKLEIKNKPDIYCELSSGGKVYFELTECVCESIAKQTGDTLKALRTNKDLSKGRSAIAFKEDALFNKSMEKFGKNYQADGPSELLSYFNQQAEPLGDVLSTYDYFVKERIKKSSFRRVWVYDVLNNNILYCYPGVEAPI